jgi:N-methylhydantoinase A
MGRLAIDIGGTFTDLFYYDDKTQEVRAEKTLTTPRDLTEGVLCTLDLAGIEPHKVTFFVHGGTTVINAITERKGAKTALITTAGFRDVLEIGRGNRPDLYNFRFRKPEPFVPRHLRFEVGERVDARGNVVEPLNVADLAPLVDQCRAEKVQAIAILFLHSYASPDHERACAAYLRKHMPEIAVTASHEVTREWREYERANTAVLNAYVQPIVQSYLHSLDERLHAHGLFCPFLAMQSNGGTTSFKWAMEHPITLLESGPSAGVNGAAIIGEMCEEPDVIFLDIGGTTAKCSVIEGYQPKVTTDHKIEWSRISPGYPVKVPVVDIVEIGTGGGSIASVDEAGSLHVGPQSAGADPGPASYDRGGEQPTITDAKLLTGVLDPDYFAGGRIKLNVEKARRAMAKIADRLRISIEDAAVAVLRVGDSAMVNALKLVSVQRGHDPRNFVMVALGGGGPMHAAALGREIGVREVIIPRYPGYGSAWGMLVTEPRRDFVQTSLRPAKDVTIEFVRAMFTDLETDATNYFHADQQLQTHSISFEHLVDMRYNGQEHWVTLRVDLARMIDDILTDFHEAHERAYTFQLPDTPIEFVNYRLTATVSAPRAGLQPIDNRGRSLQAALKGERNVDFGVNGVIKSRVFERDLLPAEFDVAGPLIIEEVSSTTVVLPDQRVFVDKFGLLHISEAR